MIKLGGAHIDEAGNAHGGAAGDQTGRELSITNYYTHNLGWRAFRAKSATARVAIAWACRAACNNPKIGYDQWQRDTLYYAAEPFHFNPQAVDKPVETDCSALVRVCCAFAGIMLPNFRTWDEPRTLLESGHFVEVVADRQHLLVGDILCTPSAGHTEIVVESDNREAEEIDMDTLKYGFTGEQVRTLQILLNAKGPAYLVTDGEFGPATRSALRDYQAKNGLTADAVCGSRTWAKILKGE